MRRALALALVPVLSLAWSCVLVVDPQAGGAHCAPGATTTDCMACLLSRCQEAVDACCFPDQCDDLLSTLERCATAHDSSCTQARARSSSNAPAEARLAACTATRCGSVCSERTGTSKTQCKESRSGEATCGCSIAEPPNDLECSEASHPGAICCAAKGWPGPALACSCSPFVCVPSGDGCFCSINEYAPPGYQSRCGGVGLSCCTAPNGSCRCGTAPCEAPEVKVDECSRAVAKCAVTHTNVPSCSLRSE